MKGRINSGHTLIINDKRRLCPFAIAGSHIGQASTVELRFCGDWCALFGEPEPQTGTVYDPTNMMTLLKSEETGKVELSLCKKTLVFDEFIDERED